MMDDLYSRENTPSDVSISSEGDNGSQPSRQSILSALAPRLMLLHKLGSRGVIEEPGADEASISDEDAEAFVDAILRDAIGSDDEDGKPSPADLVAAARARGATAREISEGFYAKAAKAIGEHWEYDTLSLVDVTIASCRLHDLLRAETRELEDRQIRSGADAPSILIASLLSDQHMFGAALVEQAFRDAGWRVANALGADDDFIGLQLSREQFDILALSASNSFSPSDGADEIARFRRLSSNKALKIFVGGRVFAEDPSLVGQVGADGWAKDAYSAPRLAENLLEARLRLC